MADNNLNEALGEATSTAKKVDEQTAQGARNITEEYGKATQAIEKTGESTKKLERVSVDGSRNIVRALRDQSGAIKALERDNEHFFEVLRSGLSRIAHPLAQFNSFLVETNRTVVDTTASMGMMAKSTDAIISGKLKETEAVKRNVVSYKEMINAIRDMSVSGRLTHEEASKVYSSLTEVGVSARDVTTIFTKTDGVLGLVNSGFLQLGEATSLVQDAIVGMGKSSEQAEKQMMTLVAVTSKLNESFGKGIYSTHQMAKAVMGLQQSLRFVETDIERLPTYIASFAGAAKQFKEATGRGISQEAAVQLAQQQMGSIAGMGIAQGTFFGQMSKMGGGLLAGERFLQSDATKKVDMIQKVFERLSGGRAVSGAEVLEVGKSDTAKAEALETRRTIQASLLKTQLGMAEPQARAFLDLMSRKGGQGEIEKALKTSEQQYRDETAEYLRQSADANKNQLQTQKEWYDDWKKWAGAMSQALTGGLLNSITGIGSLIAQIGLNLLGFRGVFSALSKIPGVSKVVGTASNMLSKVPIIGRLFGAGKTAAQAVGEAGEVASAARAASKVKLPTFDPSKGRYLTQAEEAAAVASKASWGARAAKALTPVTRAAGAIAKIPGASTALRFLGPLGTAATGYDEVSSAMEGQGPSRLFGDSYAGGVADDTLRMLSGAWMGGPAGIIGTGIAMTGIRAYGAQKARNQALEEIGEGVERIGKISAAKGSDAFKQFQESHKEIYKEIAKSNMPGWWGSVFGSGKTTFEESYSGATDEQKKAMDEAFQGYFGSLKAGDRKEADRYLMGQIRMFAPGEEKTSDILNTWIKQKGLESTFGSVSGDMSIQDMDRVLGSRAQRWNAGLDPTQAADIAKAAEEHRNAVKEGKEKEAATQKAKEAGKPLTINTVLKVNEEVLAKVVAPVLINDGYVTQGPNARSLKGVGS